jgi:hypothetical protein
MPGRDGDAGPTAKLGRGRSKSDRSTLRDQRHRALESVRQRSKDLELELVLHVVIRSKIRADLDARGRVDFKN